MREEECLLQEGRRKLITYDKLGGIGERELGRGGNCQGGRRERGMGGNCRGGGKDGKLGKV